MLKVAVVGAGYWGPNLIRNVVSAPSATLAWVCDVDERRLERIANGYPAVRTTTDLGEILRDEGTAAIILATPAETHATLGLRILEAGRHLLVEKPLALTVREAEDLVEMAEAKGVVLLVGHTFEYNAAVRKVRQLIEDDEIGEVYYLYSQRVNLGQVRSNINAMWNLAPHDVSIANYLIGEPPIWVKASGYKFLHRELDDVVFMNVGYPGERVAHIHVSWLDPNKVRRTTVVGSRKMVVYDDVSTDAKVKVFDKGVSKVPLAPRDLEAPPFGEFQFLTRTGDVWIPKIDFGEPLREEVSHFVACVERVEQPLTDGRSGLAVVRVLEAAQKSLAIDGATVKL